MGAVAWDSLATTVLVAWRAARGMCVRGVGAPVLEWRCGEQRTRLAITRAGVVLDLPTFPQGATRRLLELQGVRVLVAGKPRPSAPPAATLPQTTATDAWAAQTAVFIQTMAGVLAAPPSTAATFRCVFPNVRVEMRLECGGMVCARARVRRDDAMALVDALAGVNRGGALHYRDAGDAVDVYWAFVCKNKG